MIAYMPWHSDLTDTRSSIFYALQHTTRFFSRGVGAPLTYFLSKDLQWLQMQYYLHNSSHLIPTLFPRSWQFYAVKLERER